MRWHLKANFLACTDSEGLNHSTATRPSIEPTAKPIREREQYILQTYWNEKKHMTVGHRTLYRQWWDMRAMNKKIGGDWGWGFETFSVREARNTSSLILQRWFSFLLRFRQRSNVKNLDKSSSRTHYNAIPYKITQFKEKKKAKTNKIDPPIEKKKF